MPPDRNAPSGTSATMRRATASRSSASRPSTASSSPDRLPAFEAVARHLGGVPIAMLPRLAASVQGDHVPRPNLERVPVDAARRVHVAVTEVFGEGGPIDGRPPVRVRAEALGLGGEQQPPRGARPVERLDAQAVADEMQPARVAVPQCEGEHADAPADRPCDTPGGAGFEQHLGVGLPPERYAGRFELRPELRGSCRPRRCRRSRARRLADTMGWRPRGERSTMERRRCPSAIPAAGSDHSPASSGPRDSTSFAMSRATRRSSSPSRAPPRSSRKPASPHTPGRSRTSQVGGPDDRGRPPGRPRPPALAPPLQPPTGQRPSSPPAPHRALVFNH